MRWIVGCIFFFTLSSHVQAQPLFFRPNIVLIMVDDMGYADLGCFGSKAIQTPNLDRMAKEGMRFTQAYSGCTVCAPARSVLMTGLHLGHTSVRGNTGGIPLLDKDVTMAEVLKKAGYVTGGFGKWGLGEIGTTGVPEKQGFDEFFGYYHQIHAHYYYPDYLIHNSKRVPLPGNKDFYQNKPKPGFYPTVDPKTGLKREFSHYRIFNEAKQFIRNNKARPFFCYCPWTVPHGRYEMPAEDPAVKLYKDKSWSTKAKVIASMDSMIDRHVGELLKLLKDLNIDDNTLVLFCSDHGAALRMDGELNSCGPFRGAKRSMTEGGLRTPLIARWPAKIKGGQVSDHVCYFGDFMRTFAYLAGVENNLPKNLDSISFAPTLTGQRKQQQHDYLYWEWPQYNWGQKKYVGLMQAVRKGNWKLLRHKVNQPWELYDLSKDAGEKNNLAKAHPKRVQTLVKLANEAHQEQRPQVEPTPPKGKRYR